MCLLNPLFCFTVDGIILLPVLYVQPHQLRPIPGLPPYPLMFILLEMITRCSPLPSTRRHCHLMLLHLMQGLCSHPPAAVVPSMAAEVPLLGALVTCSKTVLTTNWNFTDLAAVIKLQLVMGCQVLELLGGMMDGLGGAGGSKQQHSQKQLQELQQHGGAQRQSQDPQCRQQQGQQRQQNEAQVASYERQCEGVEQQQQQQSGSQGQEQSAQPEPQSGQRGQGQGSGSQRQEKQQSGRSEQGEGVGSERQQEQQSGWWEKGEGSGAQQQEQQQSGQREQGEGSGNLSLEEQQGQDQKTQQQVLQKFQQLVVALAIEYLEHGRFKTQQQQQRFQTPMQGAELSNMDEWDAYRAAAQPVVQVMVEAFAAATRAVEQQNGKFGKGRGSKGLWATAVSTEARAAAAAHLDSAPVFSAVDAAEKSCAANVIAVAILDQISMALQAAEASGKKTVKVDFGGEVLASLLESVLTTEAGIGIVTAAMRTAPKASVKAAVLTVGHDSAGIAAAAGGQPQALLEGWPHGQEQGQGPGGQQQHSSGQEQGQGSGGERQQQHSGGQE